MTESPTHYAGRTLSPWEEFVERYWRERRDQDPGRLASPEAEKIRQTLLVALGLPGEVGEALEHVKKHHRDGVIDLHEFGMELGDALYSLTKLALLYGFTLGDLELLARGKLLRRATLGKDKAGEADPNEIRAWGNPALLRDQANQELRQAIAKAGGSLADER